MRLQSHTVYTGSRTNLALAHEGLIDLSIKSDFNRSHCAITFSYDTLTLSVLVIDSCSVSNS